MSDDPRRLVGLSRAGRLFGALLQGSTVTAEEAAKILNLTVASARRQLIALEAVPGMIVDRSSRPRTWRLDRTKLVESATPDEAIAACFGTSLAPLFEGTKYARAMEQARDLVQRLSKQRMKDLDRKFVFLHRGGDVGLPERPEVLDRVLEAVLEHRKVLLHYTEFEGTAVEEVVKPLTIIVYDHQLYLLGEREGGVKHPFRFSRIRAVDVQRAIFPYPGRGPHNPHRTFESSFGVFLASGPVADVQIQLDRRWASFVETHHWHRSQQHKRMNGGVRVTMSVRICPELEAWILGFGPEAEVIGPPDLRKSIADRHEAAAARYRQS